MNSTLSTFRILFFGDIVGALGRTALLQVLPDLQREWQPHLTVANVENLAHGTGITLKTLTELANGGVDIFTGGNHSWNNPLGTPLFDDPTWGNRLIVPTNYGGSKNGRNSICIEKDGLRVVIANVMGQLFTHPDTASPFLTLDAILQRHAAHEPQAILVDLHAEATAEKEAFGHYADGKVSAVLGTHTHVATADAKILPHGTAYVTDIGRCGAHDSVIGFEKTSAVKNFLGLTERNYELPSRGRAEVNGAVIDICREDSKALRIDRIRRIIDV